MSTFREYLQKIKPTPVGMVVLFILVIGLPLMVDLVLLGSTKGKMIDRFSFLKFSLSGFLVIGICILIYLGWTFLVDRAKELRDKF